MGRTDLGRQVRQRGLILLLLAVLADTRTGASASRVSLAPAATIRLSGAAASSVAATASGLWVTHHESSILSYVDPVTDRESATLEVGPSAASVTESLGSLWLAHYAGLPAESGLTRVDPATGRVALRVPVPSLCCEAAGGLGKVWAVDPRGALLAFDPFDGRPLSTTPVLLAPNVHVGLMADDRAVWVGSDTTPLLKVDPASAAVVATIDVGGGIPMTIAHDLVWGAGPNHVWAVDAVTGERRITLALQDTIEVFSLAVTDAAIWAGVRRPGYVGRVLRLDRATGQLTGEAEVALPARLVHAHGAVYVVDWQTNSLLRFSP